MESININNQEPTSKERDKHLDGGPHNHGDILKSRIPDESFIWACDEEGYKEEKEDSDTF